MEYKFTLNTNLSENPLEKVIEDSFGSMYKRIKKFIETQKKIITDFDTIITNEEDVVLIYNPDEIWELRFPDKYIKQIQETIANSLRLENDEVQLNMYVQDNDFVLGISFRDVLENVIEWEESFIEDDDNKIPNDESLKSLKTEMSLLMKHQPYGKFIKYVSAGYSEKNWIFMYFNYQF